MFQITLVTPGEVLEEYLNAYGMTPIELAKQTGLDERAVNDVIQGKGIHSSRDA